MIFDLYKRLKHIASDEYQEIIEEVEITFSHYNRARKLRIKLIDGTFIDIWYSLEGYYSFHWEQSMIRNTIYRHDNAPHKKWSYLKTFPRHCHNGTQDSVTESHLSANPEDALREFLNLVRKQLIELKRKKQQ